MVGWAFGCGPPSVAAGLAVDVSSRSEPVDRLAVTVLGAHGTLLREVAVEGSSALTLPGRIQVGLNGRTDRVRILVWGFRSSARVAFGAGEVNLATERQVAIVLDAPPPDGDGDHIPDTFDNCPALANPDQADANADGQGDACAAPNPVDPCPGNLVLNAGFETGTDGWSALDAVAVRKTGGRTGDYSVQVCRSQTSGIRTFTLEDTRPSVVNPTQGDTYRLSVWVRTTTTSAPQQFMAVLREVGANNNQVGDNANGTMTPDGTWQQVTSSYTVLGTGSLSVVDELTSLSAPAGSCLDFDDVCLVKVR